MGHGVTFGTKIIKPLAIEVTETTEIGNIKNNVKNN
jgi:hypothetical protein